MNEHRDPRAFFPFVAARVVALVLASGDAVACGDAAVDAEDVEETPSALAGELTLWPETARPTSASHDDGQPLEIGVRVRVDRDGVMNGVRFFKGRGDTGRHVAHLWSSNGGLLGRATFRSETSRGWQTARFATPVAVRAGATYIASYHTELGRYAGDNDFFSGRGVDNGPLHAPASAPGAGNGVYRYGGEAFPTSTFRASNYWVDVLYAPSGSGGQPDAGAALDATPPPPSPPPPSSSGRFPDATNTGVPDGVALSAYTGPLTITIAGAVIDAKTVTGTLDVQARGVTIRRSHVRGIVNVVGGNSVTIEDSFIDGGTHDGAAVGQNNVTMRRVEVIGARQSVSCHSNCDIQDSWLHAQYIRPGSDWHGDGYISNGGSNVVLRHNTLACDSRPTGAGGACTAALAAFGDWAPIRDHTYDNNLFGESPAGFCMYAGYEPSKPYGSNPTYVRVTNNVFQRGANGKCAVYGPFTGYKASGEGNVFTGNRWDDGTPLSP